MFGSYLTIAWRHLLRHRAYALINISGLAVGMACCILILLYVHDELSFDRHHERADRIYRVVEEIDMPTRDLRLTAAVTPFPMGPALVADFPEVERVARLIKWENERKLVRRGERRFYESSIVRADADLFSVFTRPPPRLKPPSSRRVAFS